MLDKIILGFLKIKELTAYDIKKAMEQSISRFYSSSFGSINPALKKLEKQKHVNCREVTENHRVKKYYEITETGLDNYKNWLKEPINIGRIKNDALVRLFFMGDIDVDSQKKLITKYLKDIKDTKNSLEQVKQEFSEKEIPKEYAQKAKFQLATLEFGIDYYQFTYNWFKNLLNNENK
ncbi:MAG: PadR family transcriptional regulator [Actinomycetia bacterium]|nr:PadR family transcriptional regulator [Actinomycetes bacterium]